MVQIATVEKFLIGAEVNREIWNRSLSRVLNNLRVLDESDRWGVTTEKCIVSRVGSSGHFLPRPWPQAIPGQTKEYCT
jgi:hypothetical protein